MFDVQGHAAANPTFQFGSPQFDKVTLLLANDPAKLLVIETLGNGPASYFVQALSFNGQPIEDCWIERGKLLDGGTLTFVLDSIPNQNWGIRTPPPSQSTAGR